jgi:hypothetical protein
MAPEIPFEHKCRLSNTGRKKTNKFMLGRSKRKQISAATCEYALDNKDDGKASAAMYKTG